MDRLFTVKEIADSIGGTVVGDPDREITGPASLSQAGPQHLAFAEGTKFLEQLKTAKAGAVILSDGTEPPEGMSVIHCPQPALGMARALELLCPQQRQFNGISSQACLGNDVEIAADVGIGPGACVGDRVRIGRRTEIHANVTIGQNTVIGDDCTLYSGAHIYHDTEIGSRVMIHSGAVIGADGFGLVQEKLSGEETTPDEMVRHRKVLQVGKVIIEDDVEIGANTTIDRAALDTTRVSRGTKIDNLVHIGHNCRIGRHCLLVAQVGISGSTTLGDYVTLAGQAGLVGHIDIGDRVVVGAQSGVTKNIPAGKVFWGSPAREMKQYLKSLGNLKDLPQLKKELSSLSQRLEKLVAQLDEGE